MFRMPILFYRWKLGWLLGKRFLLLNHVGRKSGKARQAVLEVAHYDPKTNQYTVAAGFGPQSHWYRNLQKTPDVTIQVGRRKMSMVAELLSPEQSGQAMMRYAQQHPTAAKNLMKMLGYNPQSEEEYRQIGQESIPFVTFHPK